MDEDELQGGQRQLDQPTPPAPTVSSRQMAGTILLGLALANAIGGALMWLAQWIAAQRNPDLQIFVGSAFLVVPLVMGFLSTFVWRKLPLKLGNLMLLSLANTALGLCLAVVFFHEGAVCLLMAAPLVWAFLLLGTLLGWRVMQPRTPKALRVSAVPLLVGTLALDALSSHGYERMVETRRTIPAPPAAVWKHVVAFEKIEKPSEFWLCKFGLPAPEVVTVSGTRRDCVFTGNLVFEEKIVERVDNHRLTFDILRQPDHPELLGHARVRRGQMELIANPDGTTTLVGRSWYALYVHPAWYFDRWAQAIGHGVHERVFDHITALSRS
ncbi:MAG: SRPBCC family protein [Armatimonas sp.]